MVKQISVFIENKSGRLAEITNVIGTAAVNIRAFTVADTSDFGVLRFIADKPDTAISALRQAGFTATATPVIAAEVPDRPGGLADLLDRLGKCDINVEYMYAFFQKCGGNAIVIIRVESPEQALAAIVEAGVKLLEDSEICPL